MSPFLKRFLASSSVALLGLGALLLTADRADALFQRMGFHDGSSMFPDAGYIFLGSMLSLMLSAWIPLRMAGIWKAESDRMRKLAFLYALFLMGASIGMGMYFIPYRVSMGMMAALWCIYWAWKAERRSS